MYIVYVLFSHIYYIVYFLYSWHAWRLIYIFSTQQPPRYLYNIMVPHNTLRTCQGNKALFEGWLYLAIKLLNALHACAPYSCLPPCLKTMAATRMLSYKEGLIIVRKEKMKAKRKDFTGIFWCFFPFCLSIRT